MNRSSCLLLAALAVPVPCQEPETEPDLAGQVRDLSRETRSRYFEWAQKREGEDPLETALPKFRELADAGRDTDAGANALLSIVYFGGMDGKWRDAVHTAIDDLIARHSESPRLARLPRNLPMVLPEVLSKDERLGVLERLLEASTLSDVREAALFWLGRVTLMGPAPGHIPAELADAAMQRFARLRKEYPESDLLVEVEAIEFELQNLQVGRTAPGFEAVDVEGQTFELSDYRGKVTVLYFWGFW